MMSSELVETSQEKKIQALLRQLNEETCSVVIKKANKMLNCVKKGIENRKEKITIPLYKSMAH